MAEYIDRDAVLNRLKDNLRAAQHWSVCYDCTMSAIETVEAAPAADVVEVRHGKPFPIYTSFEDFDGAHNHRLQTGWACPFCGSERIAQFCAACGAKMDGDGK